VLLLVGSGRGEAFCDAVLGDGVDDFEVDDLVALEE